MKNKLKSGVLGTLLSLGIGIGSAVAIAAILATLPAALTGTALVLIFGSAVTGGTAVGYAVASLFDQNNSQQKNLEAKAANDEKASEKKCVDAVNPDPKDPEIKKCDENESVIKEEKDKSETLPKLSLAERAMQERIDNLEKKLEDYDERTKFIENEQQYLRRDVKNLLKVGAKPQKTLDQAAEDKQEPTASRVELTSKLGLFAAPIATVAADSAKQTINTMPH